MSNKIAEQEIRPLTKRGKAIAIVSLAFVIIPLPCAMFSAAPLFGDGAREFFYQQFLGHGSYYSPAGEFEKILGGECLSALLSMFAIVLGVITLRKFPVGSDSQLFKRMGVLAIVLGGAEFIATVWFPFLFAILLILFKLFGVPGNLIPG